MLIEGSGLVSTGRCSISVYASDQLFVVSVCVCVDIRSTEYAHQVVVGKVLPPWISEFHP